MPGRRPKSTAAKRLTGNPGHRPLNAREPKPRAITPVAPWYLTPEAHEEWDRIAPELRAMREFTRANATALAAYCMAFARWLEADELVTQRGVVVEEPILDRDGLLVGHKHKKNPAVTAALGYMKEMRALGDRFGLDPSNRSRIHVPGDEKKDSPLLAFIRGHQEEKARARPKPRVTARPATTVQ